MLVITSVCYLTGIVMITRSHMGDPPVNLPGELRYRVEPL